MSDASVTSQTSAATSGMLTWRAILFGTVLSGLCAAAVTWSDAVLHNTKLYSHYFPPIVTLFLLAMTLIINPLLGRFRLRAAELVVPVIMLLSIGSVINDGMLRFFPNAVAYPANLVSEKPFFNSLRVDLSAVGQQDKDNNNTQWRWAFDRELFLKFPESGPVDVGDAEFDHVIGGALTGLDGQQNPRVNHRSRVTWTDQSGQTHQALALSGKERQHHAAADMLDLDDSKIGQALRGLQAGDQTGVATDQRITVAPGESLNDISQRLYGDHDGSTLLARLNGLNAQTAAAALTPGLSLIVPERLTVTAVEAPGVPWLDWLAVAIAWAPLIIGLYVGMISLAGIVRRQWMEHERLTYPIADVISDLCRDPDGNKRWNALFRNRLFWVGVSIPVILLTWHACFVLGLVPIDFKLRYNFYEGQNAPFTGAPWNNMFWYTWLFQWRIVFSVIALAFFMTLDIGFSLWFFVVALQFFYMIMFYIGFPLQRSDAWPAATGAGTMLCLIILFIGRHYYWQVIKAAVVGHADPHIRQARPYVWGLLGSIVLTYAFMLHHDADPVGGLLVILLFLGHMLLIARVVAEAGIPFAEGPNGHLLTASVTAVTGFAIPATALIPLAMIGMVFPVSQQNALANAVTADYVANKHGLPARKTSLIFAWGIAIALLIGGITIVAAIYLSGEAGDWYFAGSRRMWVDYLLAPIAGNISLMETMDGQRQVADGRSHMLNLQLIGAGLVLFLAIMRLRFSRWPLHPIGLVLCWSYPVSIVYFSVLLGWLAKALTLRYGGQHSYMRFRPVAIGLIAGEAITIGVFVLISTIATLCGYDLPAVQLILV